MKRAKKTLIHVSLLMAGSILSVGLHSQTFYNDGAKVTIETGAEVNVNGDVTNTNSGQLDNEGKMVVSGDWLNNTSNGALTPLKGQVLLDGGAQNIGGSDSTTFHQLILKGTGPKTITTATAPSIGAVITDSIALQDRKLTLNSRTLAITTSQPSGITRTSGYIVSETVDGTPNPNYSKVGWNIGASTDSFVIPFADTAGNYVPLTYDVTSAGVGGGQLITSTYRTPWDNTPLPDDSTVTNMELNQNTDEPEQAVNRFWRISLEGYSTQPQADISFSWVDNTELCMDGGCTSTLNESDLVAQRWRKSSNQWELPYFSSTVYPTSDSLTISGVSESFSWWSVSNRCATLYADAGTDQSICPGDTVSLNTSAMGGQAPYDTTWSPSAGLSCTNCPNPDASPDTTTSYVADITDNAGCVVSDTIEIQVSGSPISSVDNDTAICEGDTATLSVTGGASYQWSPKNTLSCDTCGSTKAFPSSQETYTVTVTSGSGCEDDTSITVGISRPPVSVSPSDTTLCSGTDTAILQASGAASYSWSPSTGLSCDTCVTTKASPDSAATYIVTGVSSVGCTANDTVDILISPPVTAAAGPKDSTICPGQSIELFATGGQRYQWAPTNTLDDANVRTPVATPKTSPATYTVTVTDTVCGIKKDSDQVQVSLHSLPVINATPEDSTIQRGESVQLSASGGGSYLWQPGRTLDDSTIAQPIATPDDSTTYIVRVINPNNCTSHDTSRVYVVVEDTTGPDTTELFIPNTITPNDDGVNDRWRIQGVDPQDNIQVEIYNRWGNLIYESDNYNNDWRGTKNQKPLSASTYYYILTINDKKQPITGTITIIR